jgi:hypothetical protein
MRGCVPVCVLGQEQFASEFEEEVGDKKNHKDGSGKQDYDFEEFSQLIFQGVVIDRCRLRHGFYDALFEGGFARAARKFLSWVGDVAGPAPK